MNYLKQFENKKHHFFKEHDSSLDEYIKKGYLKRSKCTGKYPVVYELTQKYWDEKNNNTISAD